ncbi:hypothetical protein Salat_1565400 [Sesamum alatum]|uniref:Uncharacterized protein n=1 Tax=Sesamum alatum TaxID=300844 RepID=A0AAE1YDB8_9LAMI|nr:hypothetical protein Salat_1565400 [Sesamum alatum]
MDSRNYYGSNSSPSCLCSPTSHPGSFRCSLHRSSGSPARKEPSEKNPRILEGSGSGSRVSKVGILKAFLMKLIKPNSTIDNLPRRRRNFQPKPTRFFNPNSQNQLLVS